MKKFTFLFIMLIAFSLVSKSQIISQYIETEVGTTPKGIEIWNNTSSTLDFSANPLSIEKGTNGNLPQEDFNLSEGTLASGDVIVIGTIELQNTTINNGAVFYEKAFTFNGNDALVVKYGGEITDIFGQPETDPGNQWSGNGVSTKDQNIALLNNINSGSLNGWADPSLRFSTISETPSSTGGDEGFGIAPSGGTVTQAPVILEITQYPPSGINPYTTVTVSAKVTDSDGTVSNVELHWGTESGNLNQIINMTDEGDDIFTTYTDIPAQSNGTHVYYAIVATDNDDLTTTSSEQQYLVSDMVVIFHEPFGLSLNQMSIFSISGDAVWTHTEQYGNPPGSAKVSGYLDEAQYENEDWMITPAIDLTNYTNVSLKFDEALNFENGDINNNEEIYLSTDYSGEGNPIGNGTWIKLDITGRSTGDNWSFAPVDAYDLTPYLNQTIYIAFVYHSQNDNAGTWEVDNVTVSGSSETVINQAPIISNVIQDPATDINSSTEVNVMADVIDTDGEVQEVILYWNDVLKDRTLQIEMNLLSGNTYKTSSPIPAQEDGTTIFYYIKATDDDGDTGQTATTFQYTVHDLTPVSFPYTQTFDAWPDSWVPFSVIDDEHTWHQSTYDDNNFAKMSGYDIVSESPMVNEDWLISPIFNLTTQQDEVLSFESATKFEGPTLQLFFSYDYPGTGNPNNYTWINKTNEAQWSTGEYEWVNSGNIDISNIDESHFVFAFKYVSSPEEGSAIWEIDNVILKRDIGNDEIVNLTNQNFNIFPNPADHYITLSSNVNNGSIRIINSLGETVMAETLSKKKTTLNINHLPKGIYLVELTNEKNNQKKTNKLIVK